MKIQNIDSVKMRYISKEAVNLMIAMAASTDEPLTDYSERQLEHEIGYALVRRRISTYYDYRYPDQKESEEKSRSDILAWGKTTALKTVGGHHIWIEIKSPCSWQENYRSLDWKTDFEKLVQPHYPTLKMGPKIHWGNCGSKNTLFP